MNWAFWRKPAFHIDQARDEDLSDLATIHAQGFRENWDEDSLAGLVSGRGMAAWVIREGSARGEPAGFVLVRNSGKEAEIITIAVSKRRRRSGAGRLLMEHAIRNLQADRVDRLFLEVSENNAAATTLYRRLGFRQVGTRKAYYAKEQGEGAANAIVMELGLV
ncbi:MAG: ribosomal protein S18-alanine N-acetyltransferase [Rhizobiaceae bacterium]